jgi:hypothetical protein
MAISDFSPELLKRLELKMESDIEDHFTAKTLYISDYSKLNLSSVQLSILRKAIKGSIDATYIPKLDEETIAAALVKGKPIKYATRNSVVLISDKPLDDEISDYISKKYNGIFGAVNKGSDADIRPQVRRAIDILKKSFEYSLNVEDIRATLNYKTVPKGDVTAEFIAYVSPAITENASDLVFNKVFGTTRYNNTRSISKKKVKPKIKTPQLLKSTTLDSLGSNIPDISVLNNLLPIYIKNNMGDPRLNYRTGRLASSYKILSLKERKEGITLYFSYMNFPYANAFEPGGYQYRFDRSPTNLGKVSIREMLVQRFKFTGNIKAFRRQ